MGRPKKRKAAEISAPAASKKNPDASKTAKKQKIEDEGKKSATRQTRSTASTPDAKDTSKKKAAATKAVSTKKGIAKKIKKVTAPAVESADEQELPRPAVSIPLTPKNSKSKKKKGYVEESENETNGDGHQYWLMKAEPESRIEKGKDVKFSIDDLQAATSPEAWDGVRNLEAKNNMRAMIKGDLAFFYHSNCKVPGIVGVMEVVEEHSVDESAFDKEHPYYDEKSTRESPKWHVVHVAFKQKFPEMITLKELQKFSKEGGVLENMQTLRRTRLSVSKVSKGEWDFIMSLVDVDDEESANVQQAKDAKDQDANGVHENETVKENGVA